MSSIIYLAFTLMTVMLFLYPAIGFRIDITPSTYTETEILEYKRGVQIACVLDDTDSDKQPLALEIEKDGETIASTWRGRFVPFVKPNTDSYEAHGQIGHQQKPKTILIVTIPSPKNEDSGMYKCCMRFLDKSGVMSDVCDPKHLTVDIPSLLKLAIIVNNKLKDMTDKISVVQSEQTVQAFQVNQTMKRVDTAVSAASNAAYIVAFSAALSSTTVMRPGRVVVFDEVVTNIGQGYNPKTGVFTVTRHGIYVFHLVMRSSIDVGNCYNAICTISVDLMADDTKVARAIIEHPRDADDDLDSQSSVTSVIELKQGVKVKAKTNHNMKWDGYMTTMFSGYVLKAY